MYLFLDKYCKVTVLATGDTSGKITLTGWIISADAETILLLDEEDNETLIYREELIGSIVVLEGQKKLRVRNEELRVFDKRIRNYTF